jgi:hypothetical protein
MRRRVICVVSKELHVLLARAGGRDRELLRNVVTDLADGYRSGGPRGIKFQTTGVNAESHSGQTGAEAELQCDPVQRDSICCNLRHVIDEVTGLSRPPSGGQFVRGSTNLISFVRESQFLDT